MSTELPVQADEALMPDKQAIACLDERIAREWHCLPLSLDSDNALLTVAVVDSGDVVLRDRIVREVQTVCGSGLRFYWKTVARVRIARGLDLGYGFAWSLDAALQSLDDKPVASLLDVDTEAAPLTRLTDAILQDALGQRASDIHLNPESHCLRLRYRIDGVLRPVRSLSKDLHASLVVRFKIMAGLDIAESRMPQDGQFSRFIHAEKIDFRLSSFPLITGENLVLRVLDPARLPTGLVKLGLDIPTASCLRQLINQPSGLVLICGPTGSGKSTTLHALLAEKASDALNIMTLEDPVEYVMPHLRQASVDASRKLDFASGLRGLLRQDPDVLLLGEIRDQESCAMALRAAMSGHQVLTTLHSSSTLGALARLLELGAERSLLASCLSGIVSQRLLRRCCFACQASGEDTPDADCLFCSGSGYYGRVPVMEVLPATASLMSLIESEADVAQLKAQVVIDGMRSLHQSAEALLQEGITTVTEISRVLGFDFHTEVKT